MSHQISLKICLNDEIRKLAQAPANFKTLAETINQLFGSRLPQGWALQYIDSDGDMVVISDDSDFQEFLDDGAEQGKKITKKVHIISLPELKNSQQTQNEPPIQNNLESESVVPSASAAKLEAVEERENQEEDVVKREENDLNSLSERRAKKIVKKFSQANLPETNKKLEKQLREAEKFLTPNQKENVERKKQERLGKRSKKTKNDRMLSEKFPTLQESQGGLANIVHEGIECNGCSQFPIIGFRYKCSKCEDLDYCEKCEKELDHSHPFIQLKKSEKKYSQLENKNSVQQARQTKTWKPFPNVEVNFMKAFEDENAFEEEIREAALNLDENRLENVDDTIKRIYASEVQEKSRKLSELFPERQPQDIHKLVSKSHYLSLEALIEKLLFV